MDKNYLLYGKKYPALFGSENCCGNDSNIQVQPNRITGIKELDMSNFTNIYDFAGVGHNKICDTYILVSNSRNANSTDELISIIDEFLIRSYNFRVFKSEVYHQKLSKVLPNLIQHVKNNDGEGMSFVSLLPQPDPISHKLSHYFNLMWQILPDADSTNLSSEFVQQLIDRVKEVENDIMNTDISDDDKKRALMCSSIFRHSIAYWHMASINKANSWYPVVGNSGWQARRRWIGSDLAGAQTSIFISAAGLGGTLGGPWGYAGAVIGMGAACSIMSTW